MLRFMWITPLFLLVSLITAFRDGDVQLVNSDRYGEGRVEVFFRGAWGTICQSGWDFNDAQVICRQLGFPNGAQRSFGQARFGEGSGRVLLSDVECQGDEATITECGNVIWDANTCTHQTDAGVRCNAPNYEGCFPSSATHLGAIITTRSASEQSVENCDAFCATHATDSFWLEGGDSCTCGSRVEGASPRVDGCNTPCIGNEDWICGGNGMASVYTARVDLPYAGSHGFPGRATGTFRGDNWRFVPDGNPDYIYIQVHQFDIPSTNVEDLVLDSEMFEVVEGTAGLFLISSSVDEIRVSYPGKNQNDEDFPGFLFEFGKGTFCASPSVISNGIISTTSIPPHTVGDSFQVNCNPDFVPFDGEVFCQGDGRINREVACMQVVEPTGGQMSMAPQPPATSGPPIVITLPQDTVNVSVYQPCQVPVVENGKVNATPIRVALDYGEVIEISCNPIYEPVNTTAVCQTDGKFFPTPACQRNETMFIILLVVVGVVAFLVILLLVLLVGCSCYFRARKRRRVRSHKRRNNVEVISPYGTSTNAAFEMSEPVPEMENDSDIIDELPSSDTSRVFAPGGAAGEGAVTSGSADIGEEEANVLQGLNDVVEDLERDNLYRAVVKPTIAAAGDFGGHFARG